MGRKAGEAAEDQQKTSKIQLCTAHRGLRLQELHFKAHGAVTESCQSGTELRQGAHTGSDEDARKLDSGWNTLVTLPPCGYGMTVPQKKGIYG